MPISGRIGGRGPAIAKSAVSMTPPFSLCERIKQVSVEKQADFARIFGLRLRRGVHFGRFGLFGGIFTAIRSVVALVLSPRLWAYQASNQGTGSPRSRSTLI